METFTVFKKTVALFLCVSLILSNNTGYAAVKSSVGAGLVPALEGHPQGVPLQFNIPADLGTLEESFKGTSGKTIIYIQDAHDSLEAQENIAKLINHLVEKQGVKTVFEEGYEGPVPTDDYFDFIKDPKIKEKVSYFFLDKLRLGGAEYAHINRKKEFDLIGADNRKLRLENIRYYRRSAKRQKQTREGLQALSSEIQKLANQNFSKELKEWMKLKDRFEKNEIGLDDYLKRFWPAALDHIRDYDAKTLFKAIEEREHTFSEKLLRNDRDRQIFQYSRDLSLLSRLNEIQMSAPEFEILKNRFSRLNTQEFADFIAKNSGHAIVLSKKWEKNIQNAIHFYEMAHKRDDAIEKTLQSYASSPLSFPRKRESNGSPIKTFGDDIAVLVFGGFHKDAIREILKRNGFSYFISSPKISELHPKHQNYYKRLMSVGYHNFEMPFYPAQANRPRSIVELKGRSEIRHVLDLTLKFPDEPISLLDRRLSSLQKIPQPLAAQDPAGPVRSEARNGDKPLIMEWVEEPDKTHQKTFEDYLVQKPDLEWTNKQGGTAKARIRITKPPKFYGETFQETDIQLLPQWLEYFWRPLLVFLWWIAWTPLLPSIGSFGRIVVREIKMNGEPVLLISEIHPSRGFRHLPQSLKKYYTDWNRALLERIALEAYRAGYRKIYSASPESIRLDYPKKEGTFGLTDGAIARNYSQPFRGRWKNFWKKVNVRYPPPIPRFHFPPEIILRELELNEKFFQMLNPLTKRSEARASTAIMGEISQRLLNDLLMETATLKDDKREYYYPKAIEFLTPLLVQFIRLGKKPSLRFLESKKRMNGVHRLKVFAALKETNLAYIEKGEDAPTLPILESYLKKLLDEMKRVPVLPALPDGSFYRKIIQLVGQLESAKARKSGEIPPSISLLVDLSREMRAREIISNVGSGNKKGGKISQKFLSDFEKTIGVISEALGKINAALVAKDKEAPSLPYFLDSLNDPGVEIRRSALKTLGKIEAAMIRKGKELSSAGWDAVAVGLVSDEFEIRQAAIEATTDIAIASVQNGKGAFYRAVLEKDFREIVSRDKSKWNASSEDYKLFEQLFKSLAKIDVALIRKGKDARALHLLEKTLLDLKEFPSIVDDDLSFLAEIYEAIIDKTGDLPLSPEMASLLQVEDTSPPSYYSVRSQAGVRLDRALVRKGKSIRFLTFSNLQTALNEIPSDGNKAHNQNTRIEAFGKVAAVMIEKKEPPPFLPQFQGILKALLSESKRWDFEYKRKQRVLALISVLKDIDIALVRQGFSPQSIPLLLKTEDSESEIRWEGIHALSEIDAVLIEHGKPPEFISLELLSLEEIFRDKELEKAFSKIYSAFLRKGNFDEKNYQKYALWAREKLTFDKNLIEDYSRSDDPEGFIASLKIAKLQPDAVYKRERYPLGKARGHNVPEKQWGTGEELKISPSAASSVDRFVKIADHYLALETKDYRALLKDSLRRYQSLDLKSRVEHSFVAFQIFIALQGSLEEFRIFFDRLSLLVKNDKNLIVGDLTRVFTDLIRQNPALRERLDSYLIEISALGPTTPAVTRKTALKILESYPVGDVVSVAMESQWKHARSGGVSPYITALAQAMSEELGLPVSVVNPMFLRERFSLDYGFDTTGNFKMTYGNPVNEDQNLDVDYHRVRLNGVDLILLHNNTYMVSLASDSRNHVWATEKEHWRFMRMLSEGALRGVIATNLYPGIFHMNDWGSALTEVYRAKEFEKYRTDEDNQVAEDPHLKLAVSIAAVHSAAPKHQGRWEDWRSDSVLRDQWNHDLSLRVPEDDQLFHTPHGLEINPVRIMLKTARTIVPVSPGYAQEMIESHGNEEFVGKLGPVIQARKEDIRGIPNGIDLVAQQEKFLSKSLKDKEIRERIEEDLTHPSWDPKIEGFREFLEKILKPDFKPRSFLEMGHEHERRMLAKVVFDYISPVQKRRLQKLANLEEGDDQFIYSMLHRIDPQKGHQLLFADVWDRHDHPLRLRHFEGQVFENMENPSTREGTNMMLSAKESEALRRHAEKFNLPRLTALDVAMVLNPGTQFVIVGNTSGKEGGHYDSKLREIAARFPKRIYYKNEFIAPDNPLYDLIYSGSSLFGMPSLYEPGGLSQREAHAKGIPSHTTEIDGLADTVLDVLGTQKHLRSGIAAFNPLYWYSSFRALHHAAQNGGRNYRYRSQDWNWPLWDEFRYQAITQDNRWLKPARQYVQVYKQALGQPVLPWLPALEALTAYRAATDENKDPLDALAAAGFNTKEEIVAALKTAVHSDQAGLKNAASALEVQFSPRSELRTDKEARIEKVPDALETLQLEILDPAKRGKRGAREWRSLHESFFNYFFKPSRTMVPDEKKAWTHAKKLFEAGIPPLTIGNTLVLSDRDYVRMVQHYGESGNKKDSSRDIYFQPTKTLLLMNLLVARQLWGGRAEGFPVEEEPPLTKPQGADALDAYEKWLRQDLSRQNRQQEYLYYPVRYHEGPASVLALERAGLRPVFGSFDAAKAVLQNGVARIEVIDARKGNPPALLVHFERPVSMARFLSRQEKSSIQIYVLEKETSLQDLVFNEDTGVKEKIIKIEKLFQLALDQKLLPESAFISHPAGAKQLAEAMGRTDLEKIAIENFFALGFTRGRADDPWAEKPALVLDSEIKSLKKDFERYRRNLPIFHQWGIPSMVIPRDTDRVNLADTLTLEELIGNEIYAPIVRLLLLPSGNPQNPWLIHAQDAGMVVKELTRAAPLLEKAAEPIQQMLDDSISPEQRAFFLAEFNIALLDSLFPKKFRAPATDRTSLKRAIVKRVEELSGIKPLLSPSALSLSGAQAEVRKTALLEKEIFSLLAKPASEKVSDYFQSLLSLLIKEHRRQQVPFQTPILRFNDPAIFQADAGDLMKRLEPFFEKALSEEEKKLKAFTLALEFRQAFEDENKKFETIHRKMETLLNFIKGSQEEPEWLRFLQGPMREILEAFMDLVSQDVQEEKWSEAVEKINSVRKAFALFPFVVKRLEEEPQWILDLKASKIKAANEKAVAEMKALESVRFIVDKGADLAEAVKREITALGIQPSQVMWVEEERGKGTLWRVSDKADLQDWFQGLSVVPMQRSSNPMSLFYKKERRSEPQKNVITAEKPGLEIPVNTLTALSLGETGEIKVPNSGFPVRLTLSYFWQNENEWGRFSNADFDMQLPSPVTLSRKTDAQMRSVVLGQDHWTKPFYFSTRSSKPFYLYDHRSGKIMLTGRIIVQMRDQRVLVYVTDKTGEARYELPDIPFGQDAGRSEARSSSVYVRTARHQSKGTVLMRAGELAGFSPEQAEELFEMASINRSEVRFVIYERHEEMPDTRAIQAFLKLSNVKITSSGAEPALKRYGIPHGFNIDLSGETNRANLKKDFGASLRGHLEFVLLRKQPGQIAAAILFLKNRGILRGMSKEGDFWVAGFELSAEISRKLLSDLVVAYSA